MCTLITVPGTADRNALLTRYFSDTLSNPHGVSILLLSHTGQLSQYRGLDSDLAAHLLLEGDFERIWIHTRYATQGAAHLDNCHGWSAADVYYMHNGCLSHPKADDFTVDSQLIGHWLETVGVDDTLAELADEYFANVFLVCPDEGWWMVHRSAGGSLYTDGKGAYTTVCDTALGTTRPVQVYSLHVHDTLADSAVSKGA